MDHAHASERFYELVWPYRSDILRLARFLCRDRITADDLAQDTLLKAFRAIDRFDGTKEVKSWLFVILRNNWRDRLRASSRHLEGSLGDLDEEPQAPTAGPNASGVWKDPQSLINAFSDHQMIDALQELPDEIRWTLLLLDVEGLSVQDAADVLQVPNGTIKSRAHRGRAMLRDVLLPIARERRLLITERDGTP